MTNSRGSKFSTVVIPHEKTQTIRANVTDYTKTKKKKRKRCVYCFFCCFYFRHVITYRYPNRRCLTKLLIALFILIIIITIILAVLLMRTRTKMKKSNNPDILRWNSTGITVAGVTGQPGNTSDKLYNPRGIGIDWSNTLYIADAANNRIQKYSKGASVGETVAGEGSPIAGVGDRFLLDPHDVVVDLNENVFIADSNNHRIQLWTRGSSVGTTIAGTTGVVGNSSDKLNLPYGIAYDSITHGIYISDYNNFRIMYYPAGVRNGTIVAGGNGHGLSTSQLGYQYGLYHDAVTNSLFIAQCNTNNIIQWSLGASNWTLIAGYLNGTISSSSSGFLCARDITLDPMGNIYVVDRDNRRIQFFLSGQSNGMTIAGITGITGVNASLLGYPMSVVLDTQLNLYVSETTNHRVQKFIRY